MVGKNMKACSTCGIKKPLRDFYAHPRNKDGRIGRCKECHKAAVRANRAAKIDYYREYDRKRAWRADRVKARQEYQETVKADPSFKAKRSARAAFWRDRNMVKRRAQIMVGNAIRDGYLKRPDECSRCGKECTPHAHHEDYYRPLDVTWLCEDCHGTRHREINEMMRKGADLTARGFDRRANLDEVAA